MLPVLLNDDLDYFWHDSVAYQSDRVTPFSIWGLWGGLGGRPAPAPGRGGRAGPRCRVRARRAADLVEVAALGAAVLIALQLTLNYWLYPYIVWFFPLVLVALFAEPPDARAAERPSAGGRSRAVRIRRRLGAGRVADCTAARAAASARGERRCGRHARLPAARRLEHLLDRRLARSGSSRRGDQHAR